MGSQPKRSGNAIRNTVLVVVLIVGLALACGIYALVNRSHMQNYAVNKTYDAAQVQALRIDSASVDVHVHPSADQQIAVHFTGLGAEGYQLQSDVQGNQLHVEVIPPRISMSWFSFGWGKQHLQLEVTLPQKEYDQLNLSASSGDVAVEDVQARQETLEVHSGDLQGQGLKAQSIGVISRSGDVQLTDVQGNANVQASSGDIRIENLKGTQHVVSASSGNVQLQQVSGNVQAHTSSGDIEVTMSDASSNVEANAKSGDIQVYLPANANFRTDLSVSSGDISSDFPTQWTLSEDHHKVGTVGTGGPLIQLQASSGDVGVFPQVRNTQS